MLIVNLKTLIKHTSVYSIGWAASSIASILLLPVYTRYLSKADYGILEILLHTNAVFKIILMSGFNFSVAKFFHDQQEIFLKKRVISTAIVTVFIVSTFGCCICFYAKELIAKILFGNILYTRYVEMGILILLADLFLWIFQIRFMVEKKSGYFVAFNMIKLFAGIITNLFCIVYLRLGVMGMLWGNLVSYYAAAFIAGYYCIRDTGLALDIKLLKKMLWFGLPMIPANLCATVMHNADRFMVRYYCSIDDVGVYGLGYQFPMMLNVLVLGSFNFIWSSASIYEIAKEPDSAYQFGRIATYFMTVFVIMQLALSLFSSSVVKILAAPKFFEAHSVIPFVALGVTFHASYTFFSTGAFIKEKTWLLSLSYLPPACFNIICNVFLLPRIGYMGAAWTTTLTYLVFAVSCYVACRKSIKISFEFKRLTYLLSAALLVFLFSAQIYFDVLWLDICVQASFLILFSLILLFGGFLTQGEKTFLVDKTKRLIFGTIQ